MLLPDEKIFRIRELVLITVISKIRILQDPVLIAETFFNLAIVLEKINETDNMIQCLTMQCIVSLKEDWRYHEISVKRLLVFLQYLLAKHGKDYVEVILKQIIDLWNANEDCSSIIQFPELLKKLLSEITYIFYWQNQKSNILHMVSSSTCIPKQWDSIKIVLMESTGKSIICKKCQKKS